MARKKKEEAPQGAPEWVLTYGDMMSLLLCFFIMIAAMSEIKKDDKFQMVMESLRRAFGNSGEMRAIPAEMLEPNSLLKRLQEIVVQQKRDNGDSDDPGIHGKTFRVTDINEGIHVEIGGRITFDRFSATLKDESKHLIEQLAARTIGHNTILKVTGHATREPLPANSSWADAWDLGYARACAVRDVLVAAGIRPERIRLISAGAEAPVVAQAYTEEELALNRRVEIVVTEATVQDYEDVALPD
ncbi:MAG TPA: flagellar motor protein MotB [Phycisphaerae bacterium]|nr:flagellar motor protein MotB [Phycisphaerae bacterium]